MIDTGMAESVTIVPIAVGATEISCWAEGGHLYDRLTETVDGMLADGLVPDYILWHQGESDNISGTSAETYVHLFENIRRVFRERGIEAPIYCFGKLSSGMHQQRARQQRGCPSSPEKPCQDVQGH